MNTPQRSLLQQVKDRLHAEGGRLTEQRRLIVEVLENHPDHPTAEEIYLRARESDETLHLSTVYRTLRWLEEVGFLSPRWFEDERRQERFDMGLDGSQDHYHFRCQECNQIIEFAEPLVEQIKAAYLAQYGGRVENATLILYGVCEKCRAG